MRFQRPVGFALRVIASTALLASCSGIGSSTHPIAQPLQYSHIQPDFTKVLIGSNSCCNIAVDSSLNRIYASSGGNPSGNVTTVVNGSTFSIITTVSGFGGANNVDSKTHNVWLAGLYAGDVEVFSGVTLKPVATVSLGYCPVSSSVDSSRRHAWIAAQCGGGNDPVWAVNADTYGVVAGPIGTGGIMSLTVLNPASGKVYIENESGNFEVNPVTFAISPTSFGVVLGADYLTNVLYASVSNGLNIINGGNDKIKRTVALTYTPSFIGVNPYLNHIYLSAGQNSIEVREGTAGALLKTIMLAPGTSVYSLGADFKRARIYALGNLGGNDYLYEINDSF